MSGGIFLVGPDQKLVEMTEAPYDREDILQRLLATYPNLLAGDQINPSAPRRWLLVTRELSVPDEEAGGRRWSLDHLFLDQEAIPTLVEVKRSTDTRARREVVAQMLDYAANAVAYLPVEELRQNFERTCRESGVASEDMLGTLIGPDADPDAFWLSVRTNLEAGRIRLIFVADTIPSELRRIVEFLNQQMNPAEVLAIEVKQYIGGGLQTLVPRVTGQTALAQRKKSGTGSAANIASPDAFFAAMAEKCSPEEVTVARKIWDWACTQGCEPGLARASYFLCVRTGAERHYPFFVLPEGLIRIGFQYLTAKPPFDDPEKALELLRRLAALPGATLPEKPAGRPAFPISLLLPATVLDQFLDIAAWVVAQIRAAN